MGMGGSPLLWPADDFAFRQLIEGRADDMRCITAKGAREFAALLVRTRNDNAVVLLEFLDRDGLAHYIADYELPSRPWLNGYAVEQDLRIVALVGPRAVAAPRLQRHADPLVVRNLSVALRRPRPDHRGQRRRDAL